MERELREIELSKYIVKIITFLTWGEKEKLDLQNFFTSNVEMGVTGLQGLKEDLMFKRKLAVLKNCIKEIKTKEGDIIDYSDDWANNLSIQDGDLLYEELDKLFVKKNIEKQ